MPSNNITLSEKMSSLNKNKEKPFNTSCHLAGVNTNLQLRISSNKKLVNVSSENHGNKGHGHI